MKSIFNGRGAQRDSCSRGVGSCFQILQDSCCVVNHEVSQRSSWRHRYISSRVVIGPVHWTASRKGRFLEVPRFTQMIHHVHRGISACDTMSPTGHAVRHGEGCRRKCRSPLRCFTRLHPFISGKTMTAACTQSTRVWEENSDAGKTHFWSRAGQARGM